MWPPHGLLWAGSRCTGQLLPALCPSNPQLKADYNQHFSTFRMKLVVTSDFMDLGPIYMHNQFDGLLTGTDLVFWPAWNADFSGEALFYIVSTPSI